MNKYTTLAPLAVAGLILAACSATETPTDPFPPPAETYGPFVSESTSMPPRARDIVVGQPFALTLNGGAVLDITVDAMTPMTGAQCASSTYDSDPATQLLRIDLTVRTGTLVPEDYSGVLSPNSWKVRGDDGRVIDSAPMEDEAWYCLDVDEMGADMWEFETNSIYNQAFTVPRQGESGTIILEPPSYVTDDRFELRYP
jgi:hypothetical protein